MQAYDEVAAAIEPREYVPACYNLVECVGSVAVYEWSGHVIEFNLRTGKVVDA